MYSVKTLDLLKRMKEKITHENTGPREQFAKHLEMGYTGKIQQKR